MIFDYCTENNFDYLFSIDTDIMVRTDSLIRLLEHKKDVVASLIWNGYVFCPNEPWKYPNILRQEGRGFVHVSNWYVKNSPSLKETKLIKVDATGAVSLIHKNVCKETKYAWHDQGEDMQWSIDCGEKGFSLYCDLSVFSHHLMTEKMLEDYINKGEINENCSLPANN